MTRKIRRISAASLGLLVSLGIPFVPAHGEDGAKPDAPPPAADLWSREALTGDWDGLRPFLAAHGFSFTFNYIGEVLGLARGGKRRLGDFDGRLEMTFEADL